MKNIASKCCFAIGIVLLLGALSLVLYNINEDKQSGEKAGEILSALKDEIETPVTTTATSYIDDIFQQYETTTVPTEPTVEVDGNIYLGYITIPALDIELPVMYNWNYDNLKISPCRYKGSALTNDLIIAAHNYNSHFGRIGTLNSGDEIVFTDAAGKEYRYEVMNIEQLPGTAVEEMEFGSADDWDLTLFTCTLGGQSRVTVRASLIE